MDGEALNVSALMGRVIGVIIIVIVVVVIAKAVRRKK